MINNRSDNWFIRKINLCKKEILLRGNYIMFFYLLGCTSLFFFSDIIQKSTLTHNYQQDNYQRCLRIIRKYSELIPEEIDLICQDFHHITNFNKFIQNLVFTWFIFYVLMRDIIGTIIFPFWYWIVSHLAILIFSLLGEVKSLQFSLDTDRHWNMTQLGVIVSTTLFLVLILCRQMYYQTVKYSMLLKILLINILIELLFVATTKPITYHLHHLFIGSTLSLCFTDFKSKFSLFVHAIMIGITIQGINFFDIFGLIIYSTVNLVNYPDMTFSLITFGIILLSSLILWVVRRYCCVDEYEDSDDEDYLEMSLL